LVKTIPGACPPRLCLHADIVARATQRVSEVVASCTSATQDDSGAARRPFEIVLGAPRRARLTMTVCMSTLQNIFICNCRDVKRGRVCPSDSTRVPGLSVGHVTRKFAVGFVFGVGTIYTIFGTANDDGCACGHRDTSTGRPSPLANVDGWTRMRRHRLGRRGARAGT
jgi:hypothetical protein